MKNKTVKDKMSYKILKMMDAPHAGKYYYPGAKIPSGIKDFIKAMVMFLLFTTTVQAQNLLNPVMQVLSEQGEKTFYEVDSAVLARVLRGDSIGIGSVGFLAEEIARENYDVRTASGEVETQTLVVARNKDATLAVFPDGEIFFYALDSTPKVLYQTDDLYVMEVDTSDNGFQCTALSHPEATPEPTDVNTLANKVVEVYFEADKGLHDAKGGVQGAVNWIHSVFEVVKLLYSRESITTRISEIFVWNTQDTYSTSSSLNALQQFKNTRPNPNGDLAHLLALRPSGLGGIAWVNTLCTNYNYAYSNVQATFSTFPNYSWTVMVIAHEMGHNLGSPHTQSCSWGPNRNQALDNCYQTEGNCAPGPAPTGGGTVMSYCHLTSYGINLEKGFGPEPGNLIRSKVNAATCLSEDADCPYPVMNVSNVGVNSALIGWNSTGVGEYFLRIRSSGAWTEYATNQPGYQLTNLSPGTTYEAQMRPNCQVNYSTSLQFTTLSPPPVCGVLNPLTFESEIGMEVSGNANWTRRKGSTPSSSTGPNQAYEGEYYLYVESSSPYNPNKKAVATTPCFKIENNQAISFSYHMYGSTMGTLNVLLNGNSIFSISGNQGNVWKTVVIDLPQTANAVVSFEGITGSGYRSDIAIDDVQIISKQSEGCAASPGVSSFEWIESIKIGGTLFLTGNNNGYLEKEISPQKGTQNIEITPGYTREPCQDLHTAVYSEDNGQWVLMYSSTGKGPYTGAVTVSEGKWRIILSYHQIINACNAVEWGEIEDYIIK